MTQEKINIQNNFDTSKISWLKSGGSVEKLIKIKNEYELLQIQNLEKFNKDSTIPIGNFSNLLINNKGYNGLAIKLIGDFAKVHIKNDHILVGAGVMDSFFAQFCYRNKISGYEFLHTIPGSIGGNIFMNAGCYGKEIKDKLISVMYLDLSNFEIFEKNIKNLNFSYRKGFQYKNTIILYGKFILQYGEQDLIKKLMKDYESMRNSSQPQKVNCCGSIFKNPPGYNAWKLIKSSIDESFYKGPIKLSKKHSNFFENDPNINSDMIILFINQIRERVYKKYNINLEPELEIK